MTVALDYTPSFYIADGQTKEFQYNFSLTMTSNLVVFTMDKRGEKTIVDKGLYNFKINPDNTGGSVTFNKAPESGTNVLIARIETPTQEKDWRNTEGFNLKSLTDEFDKLTRWCQELAENNKRSIVVPENKEDDPLDLYNRMIISDKLESVKYLKIENGNLYYSLDGKNWTMLPKSAMIQEFRQRTVLDEKQVPRTVFEYRIGDKWYTIDLYPTEVKVDKAVATSEEAKIIAETANAKSDEAVAAIQGAIDAAEAATEAANSVVDTAENALNTATTANEAAQSALTTATAAQSAVASKADKADTYTKAEVDAKVSSVYRFKGSVATYSALPTENNTVGDVWNVEDSGANYAWTGTAWDKLSETIDLTPYLTKNEAGSTYATKDELTSGLAGKADKISVATATTAGVVRVGSGSQMVVNSVTGDISLDGTKAPAIRNTIGTPGLNVENTFSSVFQTFKLTNLNFSTTVTTAQYAGINFNDASGTRLGVVELSQQTNNTKRMSVGLVGSTIRFDITSDGIASQALSANPPSDSSSTQIATTQWVKGQLLNIGAAMVPDYSRAVETSVPFTLPENGWVYMQVFTQDRYVDVLINGQKVANVGGSHNSRQLIPYFCLKGDVIGLNSGNEDSVAWFFPCKVLESAPATVYKVTNSGDDNDTYYLSDKPFGIGDIDNAEYLSSVKLYSVNNRYRLFNYVVTGDSVLGMILIKKPDGTTDQNSFGGIGAGFYAQETE